MVFQSQKAPLHQFTAAIPGHQQAKFGWDWPWVLQKTCLDLIHRLPAYCHGRSCQKGRVKQVPRIANTKQLKRPFVVLRDTDAISRSDSDS